MILIIINLTHIYVYIILIMINKCISIAVINIKYNPIIKPHHPHSILTLYTKLTHTFSKSLNHPIIDKILKGEDQPNIQSFLPELGALGQHNRQLALKLLLKKMYINKLPLSLLSNNKMIYYLKKHPDINIQGNLYLIKEQMKLLQGYINKNNNNNNNNNMVEIKNNMDRINLNFVRCFQQIKKINQEKKLKVQIMLHKRFADYYLLYFSKLVETSQRKEILQKSRDFYKSTLNLMPKLIQEQKQKLQIQENSELKPGQKKEQHEFRINSMRQNIRMLIQTNSQNVLHMFMAQNELQQSRQAIILQQNIIGLLSYFERAISYYQIYKNMKIYSIFYHRLNKIAAEINYYAKITAYRKYQGSNQFKQFEAKMWQELIQSLQKLYKETIQDIKQILKSPKNIGSVQELSLLLLSIKIHKMNKLQLDIQDFKSKLLIEVQQILSLLEDAELKKITSSTLAKIVKQTIDGKMKNQEKNSVKKVNK